MGVFLIYNGEDKRTHGVDLGDRRIFFVGGVDRGVGRG